MLWKQYVFRRGGQVNNMWDRLFHRRPIRLLYIAGRGFDVRAKTVLQSFVETSKSSLFSFEKAELLLVGFSGYQLSGPLKGVTDENARNLESLFSALGTTSTLQIDSSAAGEDDISASTALRLGLKSVLEKLSDQTDIILDVSSLPRVVYLALMTGILDKLVSRKQANNALLANNVNFQVLVAEDAALDGKIQPGDPSNDLILIPGYSSPLQAESNNESPLVWFPILGENRVSQLTKVMKSVIPVSSEVCPVLPHPSRDLRRADRLIVEYKQPLFDTMQTPPTNILYAHESHPFEAYRQLLGAMDRYRKSLDIIGGCRLVVTPLGSKLITIGAGLACFEMRPAPADAERNYGVAIPYAEPRRYEVSLEDLHSSKPEICAMLLTGSAYAEENPT